MFKNKKRIPSWLFVLVAVLLGIVIGTFHDAAPALAAATGYTDHGHSWTAKSDCSTCTSGITTNPSYTSTTCSVCLGDGLTVTGNRVNVSGTINGISYTYYIIDQTCSKCGGSGTTAKYYYNSSTMVYADMPSDYLKGTGYYGTCSKCSGKGVNYKCQNSNCSQGCTSYRYWEIYSPSKYNGVCYTTENTYTITFRGNGATSGSTANMSSCYYDNTYTLTANGYSRTGYKFLGWSTSSTATTATYLDKASVSKLSSTNGATVVLYAVWKPNTYYVTYDANGGTGAPAQQSFVFGSQSPISTSTPSKTGYAFSKWWATHTDSTYFAPGDKIPSSWGSFTLKAQWTPNNYTIVYDGNGGTGSMVNQSATYDTQLTLFANNFAKDGYEFAGWSLIKNGSVKYTDRETVKNVTSKAGNVTLYAVWKPREYTITADENYKQTLLEDGTRADAPVTSHTVSYGGKYGSAAEEKERYGYDFLGWYDSNSLNGNIITPDTIMDKTTNHTIYAQWKVHEWTVTYNLNGGDSLQGVENNGLHEYGTPVNLTPLATKEGHVFIGWALEEGDRKQTISSMTMPDKDITLYAQYSLDVSGLGRAYFYLQEDSEHYVKIEIPLTDEYQGGATFETEALNALMTFSQPSFSSTDEDDFMAIFVYDNANNYRIWPLKFADAPDTPDSDNPDDPEPPIIPPGVDLPSYYTQNVIHKFWHVTEEAYIDDLTITIPYLDIKEETIFTPAPLPVTQDGKTYNMPPGYADSFVITNPNGESGSYKVTENATTVIHYNPKYYTITFNPNGGTCDTKSKQVQYTATFGELPTPNREGYTFTGWYFSADSTGKVSGDVVTADNILTTPADITLYAGWVINQYTVTYDYRTNGGNSFSLASNVQKYNYKSIVFTNTAKATKPNGFTFIGWSRDVNTKETIGNFLMPAEDIILYAQYLKQVSLTFEYENGVESELGNIWNTDENVEIKYPEIPYLSGWTGDSWIANEDNAEHPSLDSEGGSIVVSESASYHAHYTKDITIEFKTPEDVPPIDTIEATIEKDAGKETEGYDVILPVPDDRDGYTFIGWEDSLGNEFPIEDKPVNGDWEVNYKESVVLEQIWDKAPNIFAYDRYFTLEDAQNGVITLDNLFSEILAEDDEDGIITKDNGLTIIGYDASEFLGLTSDASISLIIKAVDSVGNEVTKIIFVHVVDTVAETSAVMKEPRFIEWRYLYTNEDNKDKDNDGFLDGLGDEKNFGGLRSNSLWKTEESLRNALEYALKDRSEKAASDDMTLYFTQSDIKEAKEYLEDTTKGFADYTSESGRENFMDRFFP